MTSEQQRVVIDGAGLVAVECDGQGDDIPASIGHKAGADTDLTRTCIPPGAGQGGQDRLGPAGTWASRPQPGDDQRIPWGGLLHQIRPDRCNSHGFGDSHSRDKRMKNVKTKLSHLKVVSLLTDKHDLIIKGNGLSIPVSDPEICAWWRGRGLKRDELTNQIKAEGGLGVHLETGDPLTVAQLGGGAPGLVPEAGHGLAGGLRAIRVVELPG